MPARDTSQDEQLDSYGEEFDADERAGLPVGPIAPVRSEVLRGGKEGTELENYKTSADTANVSRKNERGPFPLVAVTDVSGAATATVAQPDETSCVALYWSLIAGGDYLSAYWVIRYIERQGLEVECPSNLVAALAGAKELTGDTEPLCAQLLALTEDYKPPTDRRTEVLGVSAALAARGKSHFWKKVRAA